MEIIILAYKAAKLKRPVVQDLLADDPDPPITDSIEADAQISRYSLDFEPRRHCRSSGVGFLDLNANTNDGKPGIPRHAHMETDAAADAIPGFVGLGANDASLTSHGHKSIVFLLPSGDGTHHLPALAKSSQPEAIASAFKPQLCTTQPAKVDQVIDVAELALHDDQKVSTHSQIRTCN